MTNERNKVRTENANMSNGGAKILVQRGQS